jgi:pimeloyl-ACP methyl ester carboxylesterase
VNLRLLVLLSTAAVSAGLLVPTAAAAQATSAGGSQFTPSQQPVQAKDADGRGGDRIRWKRCRSGDLAAYGAQCAMVKVPLNHDRPRGKQIKLAVSRVSSSVSEQRYQGVMLVNPGGPGGSGLPWSTLGTWLPNRVAAEYDWIGFDPRGVGRSRPALKCDRDYFGFNRPNYFPEPVANRDAWLSRTNGYANDCRKNGKILKYMTTVDSAKDMEVLRRALGVKRINFFGFSYGTYLGQVYSTLYPDRVRRQVFDSNVNPQRVFYQANLDQDVAFQRVFQEWFDWIAKYNTTYQLGATGEEVARRFTEAQEQLAVTPADGKIGPSEWIDIFTPVGYSTGTWPSLAESFSRYVRLDQSRQLINEYRSSGQFRDDNGYAAYLAVQCTDAPWPTDWDTWAADNWATYAKAPLLTWPNAWFNYPCVYWPAPANQPTEVNGRRVPPVLLISGTLDAPTPYSGSLEVRSEFPKARLLAIAGETGHATSLDNNRCVRKYLVGYLDTGKLPKRKSGRQADATCEAAPLPKPEFGIFGNSTEQDPTGLDLWRTWRW